MEKVIGELMGKGLMDSVRKSTCLVLEKDVSPLKHDNGR